MSKFQQGYSELRPVGLGYWICLSSLIPEDLVFDFESMEVDLPKVEGTLIEYSSRYFQWISGILPVINGRRVIPVSVLTISKKKRHFRSGTSRSLQ